MSNHLAIAAVTATVARILRERVGDDVSGALVSAGRPDGASGDDASPEVRVFLYRVEPNGAWRNEDLPARSGGGQLLARPQAALTLNYLFTCVGNETQLEPQRLLGSVIRALHSQPTLTRDDIASMVQAAIDDDPAHPLANADLADQPELVRFTPLALDLGELSNLWSVFFQAPYRLSVAYEASVVLLSPDVSPVRAAPVRERRIFVSPIRRPTINRVVSAAGDALAVTNGSPVRILGSQLRGDEITVVRFGGASVQPPPETTGDREIRVTVPAGTHAGVVAVRVEHQQLMGDPPVPRLTGQSNPAPLIIQPRIHRDGAAYAIEVDGVLVDTQSGLRSGVILLAMDTNVGQRQQVSVALNQRDAAAGTPPLAYAFADESREGAGEPEETVALSIPFHGVAPGDYLVRVQVDGAESPLDVDETPNSPTEGRYHAPAAVVP